MKATAILLLLPTSILGFTSSPSLQQQHRISSSSSWVLYSEVAEKVDTDTAEASTTIHTDPKEAVKLFGRLAEKYISEFIICRNYASNMCAPHDIMIQAVLFI